MFQGVVASILNLYLGKYIQNLDLENLNVGIFGGHVELEQLRLKPEAFYEFGLPIDVKLGTIGKLSLKIPWNKLSIQAICINLEEVFILVGPVVYGKYCPDREKRFMRAEKQKVLDDLEQKSVFNLNGIHSGNLMETLFTTVLKNINLHINGVHIRYEDCITNTQLPVSLGICLQSFSIETTNQRWKPTTVGCKTPSLYQVIRIESFSVYCNPGSLQLLLKNGDILTRTPDNWYTCMRKSLQSFSINGEVFSFIIKPISIKIKVIANKSNGISGSNILLDFVLQDIAMQLSHQQYLAILQTCKSFDRIRLNLEFWKYHPGTPVRGNSKSWWRYAYDCVIASKIQPYTWAHLMKHRHIYNDYCDTYKKMILKSGDTEIKLDLQKIEDLLDIYNVVIAREHSKLQLHREYREKIILEERMTTCSIFSTERNLKMYKLTVVEQNRGIWSLITPAEKINFFDFFGLKENTSDNHGTFIEYKLNFTFMFAHLSLLSGGKEIMVVSASHVLCSIEAPLSSNVYKLSARIGEFLVEGLSVEYQLLPIIIGKKNTNGNRSSDFLVFDFEKNLLKSNANYSFTIIMEPMQIYYHEFAVSALLSFLHTPALTMETAKHYICTKFKKAINLVMRCVLSRNCVIQVTVNMGLPRLVIPEYGSLQDDRCSMVSIVDFGYLEIQSEIQTAEISLENLTQLELEEKLYNRYHLKLHNFKILIYSRDNFNLVNESNGTEAYTLFKIRPQVTFSNSINHENRQLPKYKLNVSFQMIDIYISEDRLSRIISFIKNLPMPRSHTVLDTTNEIFVFNKNLPAFRNLSFEIIQNIIAMAETNILRSSNDDHKTDAVSLFTLTEDRSIVLSEFSDEDSESRTFTLNMPGFYDNASTNNLMSVLFRIHIVQICIEVTYISSSVIKPYVVLNINNVCCEMAQMEYGNAIQLTCGSIQLIDKLNISSSESSVLLIQSEGNPDFFTIIYKKVRSDCPDFRTHCRSIERSILLDIHRVNLVFHKSSTIQLHRYLLHMYTKLKDYDVDRVLSYCLVWIKERWPILIEASDPPIPIGATKFSYCIRMSGINLQLIDTNVDYLNIKVGGFESDFLFKANGKCIFKAYLTSVTVDDISSTMYKKILFLEQGNILEIKYIRNGTRLYKTSIDLVNDLEKYDGSFKLNIGRINIVVLYKLLINMKNFLGSFCSFIYISRYKYRLENYVSHQLSKMCSWKTRNNISIDCQLPLFLFPKKSSSSDLITFCMGNLKIENFFKKLPNFERALDESDSPIIDNILIKLDCISCSSASINVNSELLYHGSILNPLSLSVDVKRIIAYDQWRNRLSQDKTNNFSYCTINLAFDAMDIYFNQNDLSSLICIWMENVRKIFFFYEYVKHKCSSVPQNWKKFIPSVCDPEVEKLEKFCRLDNEDNKLLFNIIFEALYITLCYNVDKPASSSTRSLDNNLCKLHVENVNLLGTLCFNGKLHIDTNLRSFLLEDMRPSSAHSVKRIFESHKEYITPDGNFRSYKPIVLFSELQYVRKGNSQLDIAIYNTKINLYIPFIVELYLFFSNVPHSINYTSSCDLAEDDILIYVNQQRDKLRSSGGENHKNESAFVFVVEYHNLEVVLYSQIESVLNNNRALSIFLTVYFLYTWNPVTMKANNCMKMLIKEFSITSKIMSSPESPQQMVMYPCSITIFKDIFRNERKITIGLSPISIHLSESTIRIITYVIDEITQKASKDNCVDTIFKDVSSNKVENLWKQSRIPVSSYSYDLDNSENKRKNQIFWWETISVSVPGITVVFEMEDIGKRMPVLLIDTSLESVICRTNNNIRFKMKTEINIRSSYYNHDIRTWEPIIEPCSENDTKFHPFKFTIKVTKSKSYPISVVTESGVDGPTASDNKLVNIRHSCCSAKNSLGMDKLDSETSADEESTTSYGMKFIRKHDIDPFNINSHSDNMNSTSNMEIDSDEEDDNSGIRKLSNAFNQLLLPGDSSSESDDSESITEMSISDDECDKEPSFGPNKSESTDIKQDVCNKKYSVDDLNAWYFIVETVDRLELSVTANTLNIVTELFNSFTRRKCILRHGAKPISLQNDITPNSTINLILTTENSPPKILASCNYGKFEAQVKSPGYTKNFYEFFGLDSAINTKSREQSKKESDVDEMCKNLVDCALLFPRESMAEVYRKVTDQQLQIYIPGFEPLAILCPLRTVTKCHMLYPKKNNISYYIIMTVYSDLWSRRIIVRSPMQIKNETSYAVGLYYKKSDLENTGFKHIGEPPNPFEDFNRFAIVESDKTYNVPIGITYHCSIHLMPAYGETFYTSREGMSWKEIKDGSECSKDIVCDSKDDSNIFSLRAVYDIRDNANGYILGRVPDCLIKLLPAVILHNNLPCAFRIKISSTSYDSRIEAGERTSLYFLDLSDRHLLTIEITSYSGIIWSGSFDVWNKFEEKLITMTNNQDMDGINKQMTINVRLDKIGSYNLTVYSAYWIVNKTGFPLQIKGCYSDVIHNISENEPVFFAFRKTQRKYAKIKIYESSWSSAFSLDPAYCPGLIICRDKERYRNYHILMKISLSRLNHNLTKIVTLMPYFLIANESGLPLRFMEENEQADLWIDLAEGDMIPFWPETDSMKMNVKFRGSDFISQHFPVDFVGKTVLKMDRGEALVVNVNGGENDPFCIVFHPYKAGDIPVKIDNQCIDYCLKISQGKLGESELLNPYHSMLYTWDDPTQERELYWNLQETEGEGFVANFKTDGYGQKVVNIRNMKAEPSFVPKCSRLSFSFKKFASKISHDSSSDEDSIVPGRSHFHKELHMKSNNVVIYWVSFLEHSQRVLLFTQERRIALDRCRKIEAETSNSEFIASIKGIGLSLVMQNDSFINELAHFSIHDSSSMWEVNIAHSWKILPLELSSWIEHQWKNGLRRPQIKDYVHVDLNEMKLLKPFIGQLRRTYTPAIWLHMRKSENYTYLHWNMYKFQVDNQLPGCVFPIIIRPSVEPNDAILSSGLTPCFEGTILKKHLQFGDIYRYIKVEIREFSIQLDGEFILSLYQLLRPYIPVQNASQQNIKNISAIYRPFTYKYNCADYLQEKSTIEYLYISPLKLQFSFSIRNTQYHQLQNDYSYFSNILKFVFDTLGPDIKDLKLCCPFLKKANITTCFSNEMKTNFFCYFRNCIQQIYVLVLGIDVLTNSYIARIDRNQKSDDVFSNTSFFNLVYWIILSDRQPKIVTQQFDHYAQSIREAVYSILEYTVEPRSQSSSSFITCENEELFDFDLIEKDNRTNNFYPENCLDVPEQVFRFDKCYEFGVLYGLSGVSMKPKSDSSVEGVEMFFKTTGKDLLRLLTNYGNIIFNLSSAAIDGIERAIVAGEDIAFRKRLPKYINPYLGVRPYSQHEAVGLNFFNSLNKYAVPNNGSHMYWAHAILKPTGRSCILISTGYVILYIKTQSCNEWKIEWAFKLDDIMDVPVIEKNKLILKIRQENMSSSHYGSETTIEHDDVTFLEWIQKKIEMILVLNMENKPCALIKV